MKNEEKPKWWEYPMFAFITGFFLIGIFLSLSWGLDKYDEMKESNSDPVVLERGYINTTTSSLIETTITKRIRLKHIIFNEDNVVPLSICTSEYINYSCEWEEITITVKNAKQIIEELNTIFSLIETTSTVIN